MFRSILTAFLVVFLAAPQAGFASATEPPGERPSWMGGPVFWGALVLLNTTILTSSIGDLRFYEARADELTAEGGEAGAYWDAASREKVMIGVSAVSLLFSLAGLKGSFANPEPAARLAAPPLRSEALPTPPGPVQVLELENRVRYDTLFVEAVPPGSAPHEPRFRVVPSDTLAAPGVLPSFDRKEDAVPPVLEPETTVPSDPVEDRFAEILLDLEKKESPEREAPAAESEARGAVPSLAPKSTPPPVVTAADREETGEATFVLLPYGVHVSSFRTERLAEEDEASWIQRGERVTIEEDEVPGRGTWFRLLLGNFETAAEANAHAAELKKRYGIPWAQAQRRSGL
ncbi:MAG: SPOR domain-containing protein [Candidatus Eisenbacteria bacterium]|nr:SPOR domain-containing protein [Candidatus Eisenbacteria bacterium]